MKTQSTVYTYGKTSKNIILREDLIKAEPVDSFYSIAARAGDFKSKYIEVLTHEWFHKLISEGEIVIPGETTGVLEEAYVDTLMRLKFLRG